MVHGCDYGELKWYSVLRAAIWENNRRRTSHKDYGILQNTEMYFVTVKFPFDFVFPSNLSNFTINLFSKKHYFWQKILEEAYICSAVDCILRWGEKQICD